MSVTLVPNLGERPRILLIRLSSIGDVVVTTPVINAIRQRFPDAHLAWVVDQFASPVLQDNDQLDEVIVARRSSSHAIWKDVAELRRLAATVRGLSFDVAIDFQGLLRSAALPRWAGIPHRIGNTAPKEKCGWMYTIQIDRPAEPSSRQRCLDLLQPLGFHSTDRRTRVCLSDDDRASAQALLDEATVGENGFASLVPATTWEHKHWPEEHWARLAQLVWRELGLLPVWMGAAVDVPLVERVRDRLHQLDPDVPSFVTTGRTRRLKSAVGILDQAKVVVTVDTALMHFAVAVGTPTVALCGPSAWKGFQDYEDFTLIHKLDTHSCMPCLHHPTCNMRVTCMRDISPGEVLHAAQARLTNSPIVVL